MRKNLSQSPHRKSALVAAAGSPVTRKAMAVPRILLWAMLVCANLPAIVFAQSSCSGIHVNILDIRNRAGAIACALFEAPEGFPAEFLNFATNIMMIKVRATQTRCHFLDIPPGTYALAVIHDENMDGELNTNWLGAPRKATVFPTTQRPC